MDNERSAKINIGGQEYELILTTKATKEIAGRYGGLENLGEKLMKSENFEMALDEIVWLITLMANQSLLIHNLRNPDNKKPLLTQEEVELLTSPLELATYKNALTEAMFKGTKRNVESEYDSKNVQTG
jgi:hypothetical protein